MLRSHNIIATPPGATIREQLIDRGMSQKEFSNRMDMSQKHISRLINGEVQLTCDMAVRLEMVLGVPAQFWNNLEAIYREKLVRAKIENDMDRDIEIIKKFPYPFMAKAGWVPVTRNSEDKVINSRKFFEVANLELLNTELLPNIACRRVSVTEKADYALIAWSQKAKIEARTIETKPIDLKLLDRSISKIRSMTTEAPESFCPELRRILSDCGIAIVFLPHIGGSFLHGATFSDGNKIVLGLTVRGKDADKFWFSLFHELGHILHRDIELAEGTTDEDESRANGFARDTLICPEDYDEFVCQQDFSRESIAFFAGKIGIDKGIVVGRLQKDGKIEYGWYNDMKRKYDIDIQN